MPGVGLSGGAIGRGALGLPREELEAAEARFRAALERGDAGDLEVLGYGEISTVVAVEAAAGRFALKRLPPFDSAGRFAAYRALFDEYLERLGSTGVEVVPSALRSLAAPEGGTVAYCVQPALDPERLGPRILERCDPTAAGELYEELLGRVLGAVSPQVGLDGQLSNWARIDGGWRYLDVTTPLLRDRSGSDRIDAELFLAALPGLLRGLVRRFLLRSITDVYFDRRQVVLDFLGNLVKERLAEHVPAGIEVANRLLGPGAPVTVDEVRRYYARDARLWALLLGLRRADRWWQLRVRRRPYPFLLPGKIER